MGGQGDAPGAHEGFNGRGQHKAAHPRRGVEHPREEHREPLPGEPDGRGQHQPEGDRPGAEAVKQAGQQAEKDHPGEGTGFLLTKVLGHGVPSKSPKLSAHLSIISHTHSGVSLQPRASHCRMTAL